MRMKIGIFGGALVRSLCLLICSIFLLTPGVVSAAGGTQGGDAMFEAKNLHATTFNLPAETARYLNEIADRAKGVAEGEHMHFAEEDKQYVMLAVPAAPMSKAKFLAEYQKLVVLVDGKQRIRLADYPRLFSHNTSNPDEIRGVPTIVPVEVFGEGFLGQAHDFELFHDGKSIHGPVRWLVPDDRTGPIVTSVEGGPGKGEVTFRWEKVDFRLMTAVMYMDAAFGEPVAVEQVLPDGTTTLLKVQTVGVDMVGDQQIFKESYVEGFHAGFAKELIVRFRFEHSGQGYFSAVGQAKTQFDANRVIRVP